MTAGRQIPLAVGEVVYLVPRTVGACHEAWRRPQCTIVGIALDVVTVQLADGRTVATNEANVVRRLPRERVVDARPRRSPTPDPDQLSLLDPISETEITGGNRP